MLKSALALVVVGLLVVTKASSTDHWEERELQIPEDELSLAEEDYGGRDTVYCSKFESVPMQDDDLGNRIPGRRRLTARQEVTCALKRITHCTGEVEDCTTPKYRSTTGGTCGGWAECDASRNSMCVNSVCVCSLSDTTGATNGKCQAAVRGACEACTKEGREKIEQDACTSCKPAALQCKSAALQDYISAREEELKNLLDSCNANRQAAITEDAKSKAGVTGGTCWIWSCDSSRNARCDDNDKCVCNAGQCAVGGECTTCSAASIPTCTTEEAAVTAYRSLNTTAKAQEQKDAYTDAYPDTKSVSECGY